MATFTMQIGPLSTKIIGNDAKAAEAVRFFAYASGAPRSATNQQMLDFAAQRLIDYMIRVGRQRYIADAAEAAETQANNDVGFGVPSA